MSTTTEVTQKDLHDLLEIFEKKCFDAASCEEGSVENEITNKCECLFKQDYALIELDNSKGCLSTRYPNRMFIPEYEHGHMTSTLTPQNCTINTSCPNDPSSTTAATNSSNIQAFVTFANTPMQQNQQQQLVQQPPYPSSQSYLNYQQHLPSSTTNVPAANTNTTTSTIYEDLYDVGKIRELVTMAKYARCRQRFVVPVIMYRGKYICRSATVSINAETYGRKVFDFAYGCLSYTNYYINHSVDEENNDNQEDSLLNQALSEPSPFSYDEVIKSDMQLLRTLNVTTIVDLMVEKRKIKFFVPVSSSEKADAENHYEKFNLLCLPYPGCEFFEKFRDNNYEANNLYYDWSKSFNDSNISVPSLGCTAELNINWNEYKSWDLVLLTQNYMKACLKYIQDEKSGLLIHCISGWDRTPLFISLVRLSLWADDLIHQSLNPMQMAYFTLAYDWYLFGHQLPDRSKRGEDIMFFCFHMLKYITNEEFSIVEYRKRTKTSSSSGSSVIVIKSDCCDDEQLKEDFILGCDQDSNESFSNSSICDMSMTDNFYATAPISPQGSCNNSATANPITNRSPNAKRLRTSPISVPGASATRQRQESTSSTGSWQVVTETGSIDSTMNGSYMRHFAAQQNDGTSNTGGTNYTSNCATNNSLPTTKPSVLLRKERLNAVRAIFIQAYGKTVGLKFKEGTSMNLATFVGTITDTITDNLF